MFSDHAHQVALIFGEVVATVAVGAGIILESLPARSLKEKIAVWLIMVGIVAEAGFSISLFVTDEAIGRAQQAKIISLETAAAPRTLSFGDQSRMVSVLQQYAGLSVWLVVYPTDVEARRLAAQLAVALHAAGINTPNGVHSCGREVVNEPPLQVVTAVYVTTGIHPDAPSRFGPEFVSLLEHAGIEAKGGLKVHCMLPFGDVEVFVGVKPIADAAPYDDRKP